MRSPPYTPTRGGPEDLGEVRSLYRECATWLARGKQTDQWSRPWPDRVRLERMRNDLLEGKTWLIWDHATAVGTITVDTEEPQPHPAGRSGRRANVTR